ncbi:hypothetical protein, partial [Streptomyces sp. PU-14G]|uniref:hypothetical protein n=1 Tax=Streptomyces sp. PU-14G TaxID=2800808 RepID=UPI0034DFDCBF
EPRVRTRLVSDAGPVRATYRHLLALPGRPPGKARLFQEVRGRVCEVPLRLAGRLALGSARMAADTGSGLAFLNGRRPLLTLSVRDFHAAVGPSSAARRTPRRRAARRG